MTKAAEEPPALSIITSSTRAASRDNCNSPEINCADFITEAMSSACSDEVIRASDNEEERQARFSKPSRNACCVFRIVLTFTLHPQR